MFSLKSSKEIKTIRSMQLPTCPIVCKSITCKLKVINIVYFVMDRGFGGRQFTLIGSLYIVGIQLRINYLLPKSWYHLDLRSLNIQGIPPQCHFGLIQKVTLGLMKTKIIAHWANWRSLDRTWFCFYKMSSCWLSDVILTLCRVSDYYEWRW